MLCACQLRAGTSSYASPCSIRSPHHFPPHRTSPAEKFLGPKEKLFTLPVFPRLGTPNFTIPVHLPSPDGPVSRSLYIPDACIQPHPRFPSLTANIRKRRGEKVMMPVPIYKDEHTDRTLARQRAEIEASPDAKQILRDLPPDSIYLDCMAFGMGAGCLQMTFQV